MDYIAKLTEKLDQRLIKLVNMARGNEQEADNKKPDINILLTAALKNEWETSLITSHWVLDETDHRFCMTLARLAGDEAKHFELILNELNRRDIQPDLQSLQNFSPFFNYLKDQKSTFDRVVTGPFTREAIACSRNDLFMDYCKQREEIKVLEIYDTIQKDEEFHQQLGKDRLLNLINNQSDYERAEQKMMEVLDLVEDIQEIAVLKKGLSYLPGC